MKNMDMPVFPSLVSAMKRSETYPPEPDAGAVRIGRVCRSPALRAMRIAPCSGDEMSMAEEAGAGIAGAGRVANQPSPRGGAGLLQTTHGPGGSGRRRMPGFQGAVRVPAPLSHPASAPP